ncbi:MAG: sulfite exporter TauE/SafE family protein [Candidatus Omnitrophica bacterium]|nr:sulfite exporter TauE/SafE family protein [Candidatus Omnitrophota bacterium]
MIVFNFILLLVSTFAGLIAAISGFGIGSLITPLLAVKTGTGIAVAGVSIAHFLGTSLRFLIWKRYINKRVLLSFGITSAIGGLIGAVFHNIFQNVVLNIIFGCLLIFAGFSGLTGISGKWRLSGFMAWIAGALSGVFGGLVGNQGGIRSAAMFGFDLKGKEFVSTATGIALAVDIVRMPVYLIVQWKDILNIGPLIILASIGVLMGTEIGVWTVGKIPEASFKRLVSGIILMIGIFVLVHR